MNVSRSEFFNDLVPHFKKELAEVLQGLFQDHPQELVVEQMVSFFFRKFCLWLKAVVLWRWRVQGRRCSEDAAGWSAWSCE